MNSIYFPKPSRNYTLDFKTLVRHEFYGFECLIDLVENQENVDALLHGTRSNGL